jgi:hypothetical protein
MINKVAQSKGNFVRIWMSPSQFGIEWSESGIGSYESRQPRAFDLDSVIEYAKQKNVYIELCLLSSGEFNDTAQWNHNPYKSLIQNQDSFFIKQSAIDMFKQRVRYVIARWGYSTNICSFELFNEVDHYLISGPGLGFWNNTSKVRSWHDTIISYAKTMDSKHLYTSSTAVVSAGSYGGSSSLFASPYIDYTQDHYYTWDLNTEFQKSYLAIRSAAIFNKPYLLGEFGESYNAPCWIGASNFTSSQYTAGNYFHDVIPMHNGLWATAFSGAAGAGLYWWSDHVFNPCWGGQWQYFEALQKFWENENIAAKPYKAITNSCTGIGVKDQTHSPSGVSTDNCYPIWASGETSPNSAYTSAQITTSNDSELEVFALKTEDKILGWIHGKDNYWYNLPHAAGPTSEPACSALNDNQPSTSALISVLQNQTITINNLQCDGVYKAEFYSTYPQYDINNDGIKENGGLIPAFTVNNIGVHCGSVTIPLPKLQALGTAPYSPDYGFKISKVEDGWSHAIITSSSQENIGGELCADTNDIFYKGTDNRLHHYYNTSTTPLHEWLTDWNNTSQNVGGDIACSLNNVVYGGTDSRLHHYWYASAQWNHEWLTDWSNTSQNVGGDIAYHGSDIFYRGSDNRLHHYWYASAQWNHEWLTDWSNTSQNVGGNIDCSDGNVFYRGADDRLHHYWYGSGQWNHEWLTDWSNTSQNINGDVTVIGTSAFYKGTDNRLHHYWYGSGQWNHELIADLSNSTQNVGGDIAVSADVTHVYYQGSDNYIHQQFRTANGSWAHDWVLCYGELSSAHWSSQNVATASNKVFFRGLSDNKLHYWGYNMGCSPRVLMKTDFAQDTVDSENQHTISALPSLSSLSETNPFPNPFHEEFYINDISNNIYAIEIYNSLGMLLEHRQSINKKSIFRIPAVSSGIYFTKIYFTDNSTKTYKIFKAP